MKEEIPSPCVAVCQLDDDEQYCIGCYRTPDEIERWTILSDSEKLIIIAELPVRRVKNAASS